MLEPFETSKPGPVTNLLQPPPFSKLYFLVLPKQFHRETNIQTRECGGLFSSPSILAKPRLTPRPWKCWAGFRTNGERIWSGSLNLRHLPYWLNTGSPQNHGNAGLDSLQLGRGDGQGVYMESPPPFLMQENDSSLITVT